MLASESSINDDSYEPSSDSYELSSDSYEPSSVAGADDCEPPTSSGWLALPAEARHQRKIGNEETLNIEEGVINVRTVGQV